MINITSLTKTYGLGSKAVHALNGIDLQVLPAQNLPAIGKKMLITVGTRGAREEVRTWADATGFREGTDFLCVT